MSGTAIADAAGLGTIEIKAMRDHGYSPEFSVGVTAASATLGPIIPPSLPFVIYAMFANVSVGALFLAGILPGVVMALLMMVTVGLFRASEQVGRRHPLRVRARRQGPRRTGRRRAVPGRHLGADDTTAGLPNVPTVVAALALLLLADRLFRFNAVLPILTPVLLIGGMTAGIFTATEGAIAACVWALFLGIFWFRTLNWKMLIEGLDGHDRDDLGRTADRRRGVDLRLDADRHAHHRDDRCLGPVVHHRSVDVPAARQPADAVRRLLPRADGRDHDPGPDPAADREAAGDRPGALRARSWC